MSCISKELKNDMYNYQINEVITNSLQTNIETIAEKSHIIIIDDKEIKNEDELQEIISKFYNIEIFDENTKIHIKLKINLREYLIISNMLFPALFKYKEVKVSGR
jgi:hypothetical protein